MLLAGVDLDTLDFRQTIAVAEAALLEPVLHGSMSGVDEVLTRWSDAIIESSTDPEVRGTSEAAQAGLAAAQAMFPQAEPLPKPETETTLPS